MKTQKELHRYTISKFEELLNKAINFFFYYRLLVVTFCIAFLVYAGIEIWSVSNIDDRFKNLATVFTGGSIIIGIFYSILNYEYSHLRFKHDSKNSRDVLTFTTACKVHERDMILHFKNIKTFYLDNKQLFDQNKMDSVDALLKADTEIRMSVIAIFNYLECIALGMEHGIMDEDFMKEFFKTIFRDYFQYYGSYIIFQRNEYRSPRIFRNFTNVAERWAGEV